MIEWLEENWWEVGLAFVFIVMAWVKVQDLGKDLDEHLDDNNASPHPACPVHSQMLNQMAESLKKIDTSIEKLDSRIYSFMRHNGWKEHPDE